MMRMVKYAGISVINGDVPKFLVRGSAKLTCVWLEMPSHALFLFVKLPKPMTKINACRYMLKHKYYKEQRFQKFLKDQIERRENGLPVSPRRIFVLPKARIQRRRLENQRQRVAA